MKTGISLMLIIAMSTLTSCQNFGLQTKIPMRPFETILLMAFFTLVGFGFLFFRWIYKFGFTKETEYFIRINFRIKSMRSLIISTGIINVLVLLACAWFIYFYFAIIQQNWNAGGKLSVIYALFNIAGENTISTWYASIIFMLTGLINLFLFYYYKKLTKSKTDRALVWGWLLLSLFFTGLSADEMGSIHERLGLVLFKFSTTHPESIFFTVIMVSAGIAGLYMIWFFIHYFRSHLWALICLVLGIVCIIPGILFEEGWDYKMHQLLETASDLKQIIGISVMEEGLELLFSWFMLIGFLIILSEVSAPANVNGKLPYQTLIIPIGPGAVIGSTLLLLALAVLGVGIVAPMIEFGIEGGDTGILRNWFPSALAFTAGILAWVKWNMYDEARRYKYLILSGILVALSIYNGANFRYWLSIIEYRTVSGLLVFHIIVLAGVVTFIVSFGFRSLKSIQGICLILWFISLSFTFFWVNEPARPIDILPFLFLFPFLSFLLIQPVELVKDE